MCCLGSSVSIGVSSTAYCRRADVLLQPGQPIPQVGEIIGRGWCRVGVLAGAVHFGAKGADGELFVAFSSGHWG